MRRALLSLAMLALGGCNAGPTYHPPTLPVAPAFRAPAGLVPDAAPPAWWLGFHDPVLNALEAKALANNLSIEQALARLDQAQASLRGAGAARLPAGTADATASRTQQSVTTGTGVLSKYIPDYARTANNGQLTVNGSWDVDFAGGLRRQQQAAAANGVAAQAGLAAARLAVAAELANAYLSYRGACAQQVIFAQTVAILRNQHAIMAARVRLGAASAQALDNASARLAEAQAGLPQWQSARATQANRIAVLIGQSPSDDVALLKAHAPLPTATSTGADRPAALLRNRPDLVSAEARLIAANVNIGVALAEYYPKLSLSALLGFNGSSVANLFTSDSATAQGALGLHWRLFDFGRIAADVSRARGTEREALAAYREAVLRASEDVETSFVQLETATVRLSALQNKQAALAQSLARARRAYNIGHISRDALLDAEHTSLLADIDAAAALTTQTQAIVSTHRALGR